MAKLIAQSGHAFDLPGVGVTFGSDPSNDVAVPESFGLAPCHFAIWPEGPAYVVRDSGSGRGLWINGRAIQQASLRHGDRIVAGSLHLNFVDESAAAAAAAAASAEEPLLALAPDPDAEITPNTHSADETAAENCREEAESETSQPPAAAMEPPPAAETRPTDALASDAEEIPSAVLSNEMADEETSAGMSAQAAVPAPPTGDAAAPSLAQDHGETPAEATPNNETKIEAEAEGAAEEASFSLTTESKEEAIASSDAESLLASAAVADALAAMIGTRDACHPLPSAAEEETQTTSEATTANTSADPAQSVAAAIPPLPEAKAPDPASAAGQAATPGAAPAPPPLPPVIPSAAAMPPSLPIAGIPSPPPVPPLVAAIIPAAPPPGVPFAPPSGLPVTPSLTFPPSPALPQMQAPVTPPVPSLPSVAPAAALPSLRSPQMHMPPSHAGHRHGSEHAEQFQARRAMKPTPPTPEQGSMVPPHEETAPAPGLPATPQSQLPARPLTPPVIPPVTPSLPAPAARPMPSAAPSSSAPATPPATPAFPALPASAPAPALARVETSARFEILPPETSPPPEAKKSWQNMRPPERTEPASHEPPPWLAQGGAGSPANPAPAQNAALATVPAATRPESADDKQNKKRRRKKVADGHAAPNRGKKFIYAVLAGLLILGTLTARHWGRYLARNLKWMYTSIFTDASDLEVEGGDTALPPLDGSKETTKEAEGKTAATPQKPSTTVRLEEIKAHADVAAKFIWDDASTLFSLGFPEIEIFYVNTLSRRGIAVPKPNCVFLEKHFGVIMSDLHRVTSIQATPEEPSVVVVSVREPLEAASVLKASQIPVPTPEDFGNQQLYRFTSPSGKPCALLAVDDRNLVFGDPGIITLCLRRSGSALSPAATGLWPEFLRKAPGAFLWTVKMDEQLRQQVKTRIPEGKEPAAVDSFAVRYGMEPPVTQCFAIRSEAHSQEEFAETSTGVVQGMVALLHAQMSGARPQAGSPKTELVPVEVSRNAASAEVAGGADFVSMFLEGFYAPADADLNPLQLLTKARSLSHSFNLARGLGAPEAQRVRSVEEALAALQNGMTGVGKASAMEFQVQAMSQAEVQALRNYLTFADGYLACRPDLESIVETNRPLVEEARNRLNAETVLSLVPQPSKDKVVQLKDIGAYIRSSLGDIRRSRGAMSLFGLPDFTQDEMQGILKLIQQDSRGMLGWKPGELSFTQWRSKANPMATRDASMIVSIFNAAKAAGGETISSVKSVEEAIKLLSEGVRGTGQFSSTTFRCNTLNDAELKAAASLMVLEEGQLRLRGQ